MNIVILKSADFRCINICNSSITHYILDNGKNPDCSSSGEIICSACRNDNRSLDCVNRMISEHKNINKNAPTRINLIFMIESYIIDWTGFFI